jgi:hypothetical protein
MFKIQIPGWLIAILFILLGLLILSLIRGCNNQQGAAIAKINYEDRIKKLLADSSENANNEKQYNIQTEFQAAQLEQINDSVSSLNEDLSRANDRIATLQKKRIQVTPNPDTSATLVPNEFIAQYGDCFTELHKGQQLVMRYKAAKDSQEIIYKELLSTKDQRISFLNNYTTQLSGQYQSLLDSSKRVQHLLEQRRTFYFKLGILSINQTLPNSGGAGLIYQDKMKRLFSIGYYLSPYGSIYQFEGAIPLSLIKRK